jgi:hypothetical protein
MKNFKRVFAVALAAWCVSVQARAQNQQAASFSAAEVSFVYARQSGAASNQFAVWVEDESGAVVKTLYATRYTAKGGWKVREQSVPQWVKKANVALMSASEIDTFSSATPRAGAAAYTWDGTGKNGQKVPAGVYRVFLEASLRWGARVVYSADIRDGSAGGLRVDVHYYDGNTEITGAKIPAEKSMISNVEITVK